MRDIFADGKTAQDIVDELKRAEREVLSEIKIGNDPDVNKNLKLTLLRLEGCRKLYTEAHYGVVKRLNEDLKKAIVFRDVETQQLYDTLVITINELMERLSNDKSCFGRT